MILALSCVGLFTIALTPPGRQLVGEVQAGFERRSCAQARPVRPFVLVATTDPDDASRVAATVVPRLYQVLSASSGDAAQRMLRSNAGRIGVIIVNEKSTEGRSLIKLAHGLAPEAKVIRIPAKHGPTDITSELMAAI